MPVIHMIVYRPWCIWFDLMMSGMVPAPEPIRLLHSLGNRRKVAWHLDQKRLVSELGGGLQDEQKCHGHRDSLYQSVSQHLCIAEEAAISEASHGCGPQRRRRLQRQPATDSVSGQGVAGPC